jgi:AmiR/NasT family two-component response regulator
VPPEHPGGPDPDLLRQAMQTRATIDQAIGLLMAPGGRTPKAAFDLLVRASQRENRKMRDMAAEMVDRAGHRPSDPDPPTRTAPTAPT